VPVMNKCLDDVKNDLINKYGLSEEKSTILMKDIIEEVNHSEKKETGVSIDFDYSNAIISVGDKSDINPLYLRNFIATLHDGSTYTFNNMHQYIMFLQAHFFALENDQKALLSREISDDTLASIQKRIDKQLKDKNKSKRFYDYLKDNRKELLDTPIKNYLIGLEKLPEKITQPGTKNFIPASSENIIESEVAKAFNIVIKSSSFENKSGAGNHFDSSKIILFVENTEDLVFDENGKPKKGNDGKYETIKSSTAKNKRGFGINGVYSVSYNKDKKKSIEAQKRDNIFKRSDKVFVVGTNAELKVHYSGSEIIYYNINKNKFFKYYQNENGIWYNYELKNEELINALTLSSTFGVIKNIGDKISSKQIDTLLNIIRDNTNNFIVKNIGNFFVGFAPNDDEDASGDIYDSVQGQMLIKMIEGVLGLNRDDVYYTNALKCLPLKSLDRYDEEIAQCRPYLEKEIEVISPKLIVCLGEEAYESVAENSDSFESSRGEILRLKNSYVTPIYSPSFLERNPSAKKDTMISLLKIKEFLQKLQ